LHREEFLKKKHKVYKSLLKDEHIYSKPVLNTQDVAPPPSLRCSICKNLLKDPMITPCCASQVCYHCIYEQLTPLETSKCGVCGEHGVLVEKLVPNK